MAICPRLGLLLLVFALAAQAEAQPSQDRSVLKVTTRTVAIDIVVVGKNGIPVRGLQAKDFSVWEQGSLQAISQFEEHLRNAESNKEKLDLPGNIFLNAPNDTNANAKTVLLLDSLNTPIEDQANVYKAVAKYVKLSRPDDSVAIFALGAKLRCVQDFTNDPAALEKAFSDAGRGVKVEPSPWLSSKTDQAAADRATAGIGAVGAIRDDQKRLAAQETDMRLSLTFSAFKELADYLSSIPGRKNVAWFSGAFPTVLLHDIDEIKNDQATHDYSEQVRKTDAALIAAQIAIYPIAAEGLTTKSLFDVDSNAAAIHSSKEMQDKANDKMLKESIIRNANHAAMDQIAEETGGVASYNSNGYREALDRVFMHGGDYYTIYYTPPKHEDDGSFRTIRVRTEDNKGHLFYRHGYYAVNGEQRGVSPSDLRIDPVAPYMNLDRPASTVISLAARVRRLEKVASVGNSSSHGNASVQSQRLGLDIVIAVKKLKLDTMPNGRHIGLLDLCSATYDRGGKPLKAVTLKAYIDLDATQYAEAEQRGIQRYLEIEAPDTAETLRIVVYDRRAAVAGSLDVAVAGIPSAPSPGH